MKKIAIAFAALAATLLTVACTKETTPNATKTGPMTINAVAEGIASTTKTSMAYKYDILWSASDQIYVTDGTSNDTFTLSAGEGTTKGTFTQDNSISLNGEVEAFYPQSIVVGGDYVWPATQTVSHALPMYSKKTVTNKTENFSFSCLGSMLQIVFTTPVEGVKLKSIEIKDAIKTMSGTFNVEDGVAKISAADKAGITLDLGVAGVNVSNKIGYFNVAVPAGNYQNLTLIFTATDGSKCVMTNGSINIEHNTVGRLTLTGTQFLPAGALLGKFSVAADKQVRFSKGNLWFDGSSTWSFENNQYDYEHGTASGYYESSHVSRFYWSSIASLASDSVYSDGSISTSDVLFCNKSDDATKANPSFTVNGSTGIWRALSQEELTYLLSEAPSGRGDGDTCFKVKVSVCGNTNCLVIAPDGNTTAIKDSYDASEWAEAEANGFVCLPPAGYRSSLSLTKVGVYGDYWLSTASESNVEHAYRLHFVSGIKISRDYSRVAASAIRLVTDVN